MSEVDVAALRKVAEESLAYTGRFKFALDHHAADVLVLLDRLEAAEAKVARVGALAATKAHRMRVGWANCHADMVTVDDLTAALEDRS